MRTYDPRAVANLLLDEADKRDTEVTNLALQKLLYFAHGLHLMRTEKPLVSGYFEAWQYGPVHPSAYHAFKKEGSGPIKMRASGQDPLTGKLRKLHNPIDPMIIKLVEHVVLSYGHMSPGYLIDLSHAKNSPWDYVVDKARTGIAFGLRIPDEVIIEMFRHHKVLVKEEPRSGSPPDEDTQLTRD